MAALPHVLRRSGPAAGAAPRRSWWRAPVRVWVRRVHLWATLSLGLLLVVCTSGAAIVFRPELDHWQHRTLYTASAGTPGVTLGGTEQAVRAAYPDQELSFVRPPRPGERFLAGVGDPYRLVLVDPVSGQVAGDYDPDGGVLGFVRKLHTSPFSDEVKLPGVGWPLSQVLLSAAAIALLAMVLTGAVLWWPGVRRFVSNGVGVRLGKNAYTSNHDLHKVVGVAALLPLLFWALTGANFELYDQVHAVFYALTPGEPPADPEELASGAATAAKVTAEQAKAVALAALPGSRFSAIVPPADEKGYWDVWLARGIDPYEHGDFPGESSVQVDQYSGAVLQTRYATYDNPLIEGYEMWAYPLHSGIVVPWPARFLWLLLGLAPLALGVTGVAMWWLKRRNKRRAQRLRAERQAGAPLGPEVGLGAAD